VYTFCTPKYTFLANIFVFEIGSALCGAAPSSTAFIIGRAIAGFAAAGVQVGNVIILTSIVPLKDRPKYMGFLGL
jgi:MFS family permease